MFFETSIDLTELLALGWHAALNQSGKAKAGPVSVRVLSRRKLP